MVLYMKQFGVFFCLFIFILQKLQLFFNYFQETRESLGVRMALGETQIVTETRNFLIDNGVCLDSFSQVRKIFYTDLIFVLASNL